MMAKLNLKQHIAFKTACDEIATEILLQYCSLGRLPGVRLRDIVIMLANPSSVENRLSLPRMFGQTEDIRRMAMIRTLCELFGINVIRRSGQTPDEIAMSLLLRIFAKKVHDDSFLCLSSASSARTLT